MFGVLFLALGCVAFASDEFTSAATCSRALLIGNLPSPEEDSGVAGSGALKKFRAFLKSQDVRLQRGQGTLASCSARASRRPRGRRLSTSVNLPPDVLAMMETAGADVSVTSLSFPYRRGAIVQAYAGMDVSGPTVDGHDPNHTFFNAPVAVASNLSDTTFLLADEGSSRIMLIRPSEGSGHQSWENYNTSTILTGDWQLVQEADRFSNISMRTPSAFIQHKDWIYITEHDNGRILRISAKNLAGGPRVSSEIQIIANAAGNGGMSGDCGPATLATIRRPQGIALIPARKGAEEMLAFTDSGNNRVRGFELTDWPSCLTSDTDCSAASNQIDLVTGKACATTCSTMTTSPDQCAFNCRHLGLGNFPVRYPERSVTLTSAQLAVLLRGCGADAVATVAPSNAYLMQCLSAKETEYTNWATQLATYATVPASLTSYPVVKDFTMGSVTIKAGERLLGVVVAGALMRLNSSQIDPAYWGTSGGVFRISNPSTLKCKHWYWDQTAITNSATGARQGSCYLFSNTVAPTCAAGTGSSGPEVCRPGKIRTLIGGGSPGMPSFNSAVGQPYTMNPLDMMLKKPSSLLLMNAGQYGEPMREDLPAMTLLVSDTANHRLVGLPLADHKKYHVRFWLMVQGVNAESTVVNQTDQAIAWALGHSMGWHYTFTPVNLSTLTITATPAPSPLHSAAHDKAACNPERLDNSVADANHAEESHEASSYGTQICPSICSASSFASSGFASQACCSAFCSSAFSSCSLQLATWGASVSSLQKCTALTQMQSCLATNVASAGAPAQATCTGQLVDSMKFMDAVIGATPGYLSSLHGAGSACDFISPANSIGCGGKCDKKISDILQVNTVWLGGGTAGATVGVLYDMTTFDLEAYRFFGKVLSDIKYQEQNITQSAPGTYPTSSGWTQGHQDNITRWGLGTLAYDFFQVYWFSMNNWGGSASTAPMAPFANVAFSSVVSWSDARKSSFMSFETVREGTAYWMAGKNLGTKSGYDTEFNNPTGLIVDKAQRLYVSDSSNARIMRIQNIWFDTNYSTVPVGTGYATFNGNGDAADETSLAYPRGLTMDNDGILYFADTRAHDIRQVLGITWNLPCTQSTSYYNKLANPQQADIDEASSLLGCRLVQVRSLVLNQVNLCIKCHSAGAIAAECPSSMVTSLCSTSLTSIYEASAESIKLTEQLKEISDCGGCPLEHGCHLPEADLVWNETLNNTYEGDNSPFEMTRLLSDTAATMALNAIDSILSTQTQPLSWAGLLSTEINACVNSVGNTALQTAIAALKVKLCSSGSSAALFLAKIYFEHWYTYVSDVCVEVIDSPDVDKAALLGAQFYDKMSAMVSGVFWHAFDAMTSTWSPSVCQPACDLMHPRFFITHAWKHLPFKVRSQFHEGGETIRLPEKQGKCCGLMSNGYPCNLGEGPCELNEDCGTGLVCGRKNCLWSKDENCCSAPDSSNSYARMRDFSRATGFTELANMWSYSH